MLNLLLGVQEHPGFRQGHSAVWDFSDSLIVFGGLSATSVYNEVHVLSLSTGYWSRPECTGQPPPKRYGHSAVMVAANLMLLFGGCSAQVCSLFWTLLGYFCHSSCLQKCLGVLEAMGTVLSGQEGSFVI